MPGKKPPRGENPVKILFPSIVFFEIVHPRQNTKPSLHTKSTSQIFDLFSSNFDYVAAPDIRKLLTSSSFWHQAASGINETRKTLISQTRTRNRERGTKKISFFSLDSTQLTLLFWLP